MVQITEQNTVNISKIVVYGDKEGGACYGSQDGSFHQTCQGSKLDKIPQIRDIYQADRDLE